ncbi:cardiolipin synthase [Oleidesulfovibrio sp.]|uniref:cardiolipin synthase n=1 Tax=Oleidesulfovibrio sp. TaxID=2909707 RepID=UPI003A84A6F1
MDIMLLSGLLVFLNLCVSLVAAGHALLNKRDPRAALGWVAVCLTFPIAGPILYFVFGINRVRSKAEQLHEEKKTDEAATRGKLHGGTHPFLPPGSMDDYLIAPIYRELQRPGLAVSGMPLVGGNDVLILHNGEQAYPRMLEAIESAEDSLFLTTYIFETGAIGRQFIDALAAAAARGVDVRVLIDGVGELYAFPRASSLLKKRGVRVARFLPPRLLPPQLSVNLRNHRKVLVADGQIGFTGGMNIGRRHMVQNLQNKRRTADMHFGFSGPVVAQLQEAFLDDWGFTTGEYTLPRRVTEEPCGDTLCRVVKGGPGQDIDRLSALMMGVISSAGRTVRIMTPYFLPSSDLVSALQAAALRGVRVDVILPEKNNLPAVHWATRNLLWQLLRFGIHIHYQPPPFAHTKMLLIDGSYAQIGSANIDPRSLRLNFELNMEIFDTSVVRQLTRHFDAARRCSYVVTREELDRRSLPVRMRDAMCWLFTPYL